MTDQHPQAAVKDLGRHGKPESWREDMKPREAITRTPGIIRIRRRRAPRRRRNSDIVIKV
jgi:hypothetical protein